MQDRTRSAAADKSSKAQAKGAETLGTPEFFSHVLLETNGTDRTRRRWSAAVSLGLQGLLLGVVLITPLLFTEVLPARELVTTLLLPPPPPPPPPPPALPEIKLAARPATDLIDGQLRAPSKIPKTIAIIKEDQAPVSSPGIVGGVEGGVPGGQLGGVIGGILSATSKVPELPKTTPTPRIVRISQGVSEGMLVNSVVPEYPSVARLAHIQGNVELKAIIASDGSIQQLQLVGGSPLLAPAAIRAVQHWHYRPYLLNGVPVAVETNITVKFKLTT